MSRADHVMLALVAVVAAAPLVRGQRGIVNGLLAGLMLCVVIAQLVFAALGHE